MIRLGDHFCGRAGVPNPMTEIFEISKIQADLDRLILEILAHFRYPIEKFLPFLVKFGKQVYKHFILSISENNNRTFMAEGYGQLNAFDHLINQKVRPFRTFSKLLEALQYETALR